MSARMSKADDRPYTDCPHCGMPMWGGGRDGPGATQFCPHCGMPVRDSRASASNHRRNDGKQG